MAYISKKVERIEKIKVTFKKSITRRLVIEDEVICTIYEEGYRDIAAQIKRWKEGDDYPKQNSVWAETTDGLSTIGAQKHGQGRGPESSYSLCLGGKSAGDYDSYPISFHDLKRLFRVR